MVAVSLKKKETIPGSGTGNISLGSVSSIISKYQEINDAIIREAETNVPFSGYDTSYLYVKPTTDDGRYPTDPLGLTSDGNITADSGTINAGAGIDSPGEPVRGYLTYTAAQSMDFL